MMETEDLSSALAPFASPEAGSETGDQMVEQLRAALDAVLVRASVASPRLEEEDSVARSRQAYVAAILRLLDYLLMTPTSMDAAAKQGAIALGYVRHIETSRLAALQLGRTVRDGKLSDAVQKMRQELSLLSDKKALVQNEARDRAQVRRDKASRG